MVKPAATAPLSPHLHDLSPQLDLHGRRFLTAHSNRQRQCCIAALAIVWCSWQLLGRRRIISTFKRFQSTSWSVDLIHVHCPLLGRVHQRWRHSGHLIWGTKRLIALRHPDGLKKLAHWGALIRFSVVLTIITALII